MERDKQIGETEEERDRRDGEQMGFWAWREPGALKKMALRIWYSQTRM